MSGSDEKSADRPDEAIDSVIAESAGEQSGSQQAPAKKPATSHMLLAGLLMIVLIVAGLAASGQLKPLYESVMAKLETSSQPRPAPAATQTAPAPVVKPAPAPKVTHNPEPATQPQSGVTSEEVSKLLSTIEGLRAELQQLEQSQRTLRSGLIEQQQMNLQVRLRWIMDPASRLPQVQLAWEEISLLPGLSAEQRDEATSMHALARTRVQQLRQWQDELKKWADALSTPVHHNIIPKPDHPWLEWIVNQFQLRQAPSEEARRLGALREKLLVAARQLALESWPAEGGWQSLHAELLLQIKAMQNLDDSATVEIGLPESFDGIRADIATLRQTARAWSRSWQGGDE